MHKLWAFFICLSSVSTVQAVTTRSGLRTTLLSTEAATRTRFETRAIPVALLPDCDLTGVQTLSLFGPFDAWGEQVAQLSLEVRRQITRLDLNGSHGPVVIDEVKRTLSRVQYLNRCADEPVIDLFVLKLFPELREVAFNWVRNFDVNQFTAMTWPNIRRFEFPYMRIGSNTDWLSKLNAGNLEILDLSGNIISARQIEAVAADLRRNCPHLQTIDISSEHAFDVGEYANEDSVGMQYLGDSNYTPEIRWVEDLPQRNAESYSESGTDQEGLEEDIIERIFNNYEITVENNQEDNIDNESSSSVSHRSASASVQESGNEN
jgi:hypothetical protein